MTKYTPGPWFRQSKTDPDGTNHEWITASKNTGVKGEHYMAVHGCISQEDGRLIQAAPDLLEALIELREEHSRIAPHHEDMCPLCKKADAAIKKARGEA